VPVLVEQFLTRQKILPVAAAGVSAVRGTERIVTDAGALKAVLPDLKPGDSVVFRDGTWTDADLVFRGMGTAEAPITLRAQTPGKVVLTGASRLRLAGQHLVVDGLLFQNCVLQKGQAVVAFRDGDEQPAVHCRLTNSAIIDCNPPDYLTDYKWVSLYGTDNRVDHCRFAGKNHQGTLLVVWLDGQPNRHRIDHNFFGPRPPHDRNGAETIRVGTSDWSHTRSETVVEDNFFYRCDGEQEIISNKSWHNTYRRNTFVECQGALTLRHGHACLVEGNVFIGRGREKTGGVRIIGNDHRVIGNRFEGLTGDRFYAALSMVLGIPDSPASGYHQVRRAEVAGNTFVDCAHVFSLGIMEGRPEATLPPIDSVIADNRIVRPQPGFFSAAVPLAGFRIEGNRVAAAPAGLELPAGFVPGDAMPSDVADAAGVVTPVGVGTTW
jgi:poly(beta-D-mannuronate) lyase